ncbi:GNAT family N-acetyltransferase [Paenibacillus sp. P2(2022)]|uniref:GNAT family N-acetyltransferase n=1 Tax=Paenibacillus TaxID=44249 RepID=UPI0005ED12FC|nr:MULTISPECIES: GNAT family N-acetyltransferase [Paenibacillus]AUS25948.1 GNAT family acetyltraansferase [Paenibacillus polymyxa]KAE8557953.1 GNAT family N-acetyltransferase [Paenibacillus polymyxa]KJK32539.1 GNAT family acetyltraansferase [Paenibacillus polymyxa]MCJ1218883.1 GNAT family N-acetyltransferase [Paenibacillus polymyxa]MDG0053896.1 GNAT family N-acetyltransferase [Paenibacillus sp. P2(2022)]
MINEHDFSEIYAIMESSFPASECRTFEAQKALLKHPSYRIITEKNEQGNIVAFLAGWEFAHFRFVEHIAVDSRIRGGGLGQKLMGRFISQSNQPVVLEVEPPVDEWSRRRIGFYERLGFHLNHFEYVQPPLREGQTDLRLQIMSYPGALSEQEFTPFKEILYTEVYGLK